MQNTKVNVEVSSKGEVTEIVEGTIEDAFAAGYCKKKEGKRTPIWNLAEWALIDIFKQL